jgi:hypothetical protein
MSQTLVTIFMIASLIIISGVDVYLANDNVKGNTYSAKIRAWSRIFPPLKIGICVFFGMLLAHWYWTVVEYVNCK